MPRKVSSITMEADPKASAYLAAIGQIKKVANCRKGAFTFKEVTLHIPTNAGTLSPRDRLTLDSMYEAEAYVNIELQVTQPPADLRIPPESDDSQAKIDLE